MTRDETTGTCRMALELGREHHLCALTLHRLGRLDREDARLTPWVLDPDAPLASGAKGFVGTMNLLREEARAGVEALGDGGRSDRTARCEAAARRRDLHAGLAAQGKLLGAVARSGDAFGLEAGSVAISMEGTAAGLQAAGAPPRLCMRLFGYAARAVDGVVLAERHRGWQGLMADVVAQRGIAAPEAVRGLRRAQLLAPDDPRLRLDAGALRACATLEHTELLDRLEMTMLAHLDSIGPTREAAFAPEAIEAELLRWPAGRARKTEAQTLALGATHLHLVARVAERIAMNRHAAGGADAEAALGDLLVPSAEAARRSAAFAQRARETGPPERARREDGPVLM